MSYIQNPYIPSISASEVSVRGGTLVDVRKSAARAADGRDIPGAQWVDPFALDHAHPLMTADGPITFFCVAGHEVSQFACALARVNGRDAVFVEGGFVAMVAAGLLEQGS